MRYEPTFTTFSKNKENVIFAIAGNEEKIAIAKDLDEEENWTAISEAILEEVLDLRIGTLNQSNFIVDPNQIEDVLMQNKIVNDKKQARAILDYLIHKQIFPVREGDIYILENLQNASKAHVNTLINWQILIKASIGKMEHAKNTLLDAKHKFEEEIEDLPPIDETIPKKAKEVGGTIKALLTKKAELEAGGTSLPKEDEDTLNRLIPDLVYYKQIIKIQNVSPIIKDLTAEFHRIEGYLDRMDALYPILNRISGEIELVRAGRKKDIRMAYALAQGFENIIMLANGMTTVSHKVKNMTTGDLMDTLMEVGVDGLEELQNIEPTIDNALKDVQRDTNMGEIEIMAEIS